MQNEITIGFDYIGECGDSYSASSTLSAFPELGESTLDVIGRQFNQFLRQIGFYRPNDNIFMPSITDEEYCAMEDFLCELRTKNEKEQCCCNSPEYEQMSLFDEEVES